GDDQKLRRLRGGDQRADRGHQGVKGLHSPLLKKIVLLFKLTFVPEKTVTDVQKKQTPEAPSSNRSVFDRRRERGDPLRREGFRTVFYI
ncbi:MAG: hypothetical protein II192_08525, partial [Clostridia bacterium]|nr:hypothetical protein [Clostridia bacterium]